MSARFRSIVMLLVCACDRDPHAPAIQSDSLVAPDHDVAAVSVDGDGLRLFVVSTGASRPLAFGTDSALVHGTIIRATGADPVETGVAGDCPGSFARWENGLMVRYLEGRFVGWSLHGGDSTVTTASGAGIGTSRAQLEDAVPIDVRTTSLGSEFTAGNLAGLLDNPDSAGKVTNLWAGEVCIAR